MGDEGGAEGATKMAVAPTRENKIDKRFTSLKMLKTLMNSVCIELRDEKFKSLVRSSGMRQTQKFGDSRLVQKRI